MGRKILMICGDFGDFGEDDETMVPFLALRAVVHVVHAIAPDKKAGEYVATAIHDFDGAQTHGEKPGHRFALNASLADIRAESDDPLVAPGGRAPEYLRRNSQVVAMTKQFLAANKPVATARSGSRPRA